MYAKTHAFASGDFSALALLLEAGADINAQDSCGLTVLDYVEQRSRELISWLASSGAQRAPRPWTSDRCNGVRGLCVGGQSEVFSSREQPAMASAALRHTGGNQPQRGPPRELSSAPDYELPPAFRPSSSSAAFWSTTRTEGTVERTTFATAACACSPPCSGDAPGVLGRPG